MALMEVRDAAFTYDNKRMIFDGINFYVEKGEIMCIIGPNGCGKSTLIDCMLGLKKLNRGEIFAGGRDINKMKPKEFAEHVAYVPQGHKTTFAYTVLDVVTMG
ncbi:MAG: ATP-binding cassette domain-containing protein, partial [Lentihominibacter sp.]